jgi:hypothetical protein
MHQSHVTMHPTPKHHSCSNLIYYIQLKAPLGGVTATFLFWTIAKALLVLGAFGAWSLRLQRKTSQRKAHGSHHGRNPRKSDFATATAMASRGRPLRKLLTTKN